MGRSRSILQFLLGLAFLLALLAPLLVLLALLTARPAGANDELMIGGNFALSVNRPISVLVVADAAELCRQDGYEGELYGCAKNAFGKGRCVIYIRPDKMEYLYHELQHCAGLDHK
jgi:hypothetical protein